MNIAVVTDELSDDLETALELAAEMGLRHVDRDPYPPEGGERLGHAGAHSKGTRLTGRGSAPCATGIHLGALRWRTRIVFTLTEEGER